jgi:hypothetical protein
MGTTDAAGRFTLATFGRNDGARLGAHSVGISKFDAGVAPGGLQRSLLPQKYASAQTSGLTVEVRAGGPNEFRFELRD